MDLEGVFFSAKCLEYLAEGTTNYWFDPIDPSASISQSEICDMFSKLFAQLKAKGITSVAEYISFSYMITLDLYLYAHEQNDFESCI